MTDAQIVDSNAELAAALKQQAESNTKVDALLRLTREQNLADAKRVIKLHGFSAKELAPELKQKRSTNGRAATPRKSPAVSKEK